MARSRADRRSAQMRERCNSRPANRRWSGLTSATVAAAQTVPTAPSASAPPAAIRGPVPTRTAISVTVASVTLTKAADSRFARNATDPTGSSWASQPIRM